MGISARFSTAAPSKLIGQECPWSLSSASVVEIGHGSHVLGSELVPVVDFELMIPEIFPVKESTFSTSVSSRFSRFFMA